MRIGYKNHFESADHDIKYALTVLSSRTTASEAPLVHGLFRQTVGREREAAKENDIDATEGNGS